MELGLEHAFQQSGAYMTIQLLFMSSLLIPGAMGMIELYRAAVRTLTSFVVTFVVTFGPMALLLYILYEVSKLS